MSATHVAELLCGEARGALKSVARYVSDLAQGSNAPKLRNPEVWGPTVQGIVEKVLNPYAGGLMVRKREDARNYFGGPLRTIISTLHETDGHRGGEAPEVPPLTFAAADILYQHMDQLLGDKRVASFYVQDYGSVLATLLRVRKYACWLRAELLVGLCNGMMALLRQAIEGPASAVQADAQQAGVALCALLAAYPRALPPHLVTAYLDLATQLLKQQPTRERLPLSLALHALRGLNAVLRRVAEDDIARSRSCAADLGAALPALWSGTNDSVRCEVVEFYAIQMQVQSIGRPPPGDPLRLEALWGLLRQALSTATVYKGLSRRDNATDARVAAFVGLAADVAVEVTRAKAERPSAADPPADTPDAADPPAKRRRLQLPLQQLLAAVGEGARGAPPDSTALWLRTLGELLRREAARPAARRVLRRQDVAEALRAFTAVITTKADAASPGGETADALALAAAAAAAAAVEPGPPGSPDAEAAGLLRDRLRNRAAAEAPTQGSAGLLAALGALTAAAARGGAGGGPAAADLLALPPFACPASCGPDALRCAAQVAGTQGGAGAVPDPAAARLLLWALSGVSALPAGAAPADAYVDAAVEAVVALTVAEPGLLDGEGPAAPLGVPPPAPDPGEDPPPPTVPVLGGRRRALAAAAEAVLAGLEQAPGAPAARGGAPGAAAQCWRARVARACAALRLLLALLRRGVWTPASSPRLHHCAAELLRVVATRWAAAAAPEHGPSEVPAAAVMESLLALLRHGGGCWAAPALMRGKGNGAAYAGSAMALARRLVAAAEVSATAFAAGAHGTPAPAQPAMDLMGTVRLGGGAPVPDAAAHAELSCTCAAAAAHALSARPELRELLGGAEPSLAPEAVQCVDRTWAGAKRGRLCFPLLELLAASSPDPAAAHRCISNLREVLAMPVNKCDDDCHQAVLRCLASCVQLLPSLDEGAAGKDLVYLVQDTLQKLGELASKGLLSPAGKRALVPAALAVFRKADGAALSAALDALLPLLTDGTRSVRLAAAAAAPQLVGLFERPQVVFSTVCKQLHPLLEGVTGPHGTNSRAQTSITAIAQIALRCPAVQGPAVLQLLLVHVQDGFSERAHLEECLAKVAEGVGAGRGLAADDCPVAPRGVADLIGWHMEHVAREWVVARRMPLRRFPYALADCACYEDFLERYMPQILSAVLQSPAREDLVTSLCDQAGVGATELLVRHIAPVFGQSYLQYYVGDGSVARAVCEEYVKSKVSGDRLSGLLEKAVDGILETFLRLESPESEPPLPEQPGTVVDRAFSDFCQLWTSGSGGKCAVETLLSATPDRAFRLLLSVGDGVLSRGRLVEWRQGRWVVLARLLRRCGGAAVLPHCFRLAAHLCIEAAALYRAPERDPDPDADPLDVLAGLCRRAAKAAPAVLARHLPTVVARLLPLAAEDPGAKGEGELQAGPSLSIDTGPSAEGAGEVRESAAARCMRIAIEAAAESEQCRAAARGAVSPLPAAPCPALRRCAQLYDQLVGRDAAAPRFAAYIDVLTTQAAAAGERGGAALRLQVLRRLEGQLQGGAPEAAAQVAAQPADAAALAALLGDLATAGPRGGRGADGQQHSRQDDDAERAEEMALSAASCLLALRSIGVQSAPPADALPADFVQLPKISGWHLGDYLALRKLRALRQLCDAVCGSDSQSVAVAAETLWEVGGLSSTAAMLEEADDPTLLDDLAPFLPRRGRSGRRAAQPARPGGALEALGPRRRKVEQMLREGKAELWAPSAAGWAGKVACALLASHGADSFLRHCAPACLALPTVAEALFPAAVAGLVCAPRAAPGAQDQAQAAQCTAGSMITAEVLPGAAEHPGPARLAIGGLMALRALLREDVRREGVPRGPAAVLPEEAAKRAAGVVTAGAAPPLLQRVPLAALARAALQCGAPAAALALAEGALERPDRGGLVFLNPPWEAPARDPRKASDLLDVLSRAACGSLSRLPRELPQPPPVAPTKGVHAASRCGADSPETRALFVAIAAHMQDAALLKGVDDGTDWETRTAHYAQPQDWPRALAAHASAAAISSGKAGSAERALAAELGMLRALRRGGTYAALGAARGGAELEELRAESAWVLGQWGDTEAQEWQPQAGAAAGFHSGILAGLRSAAKGDAAAFAAAVGDVRSGAAELLRCGNRRRLPEALARVAAAALLSAAWPLLWDESARRRPSPPDDAVLGRSGLLPGPEQPEDDAERARLCAAADLLRPQLLRLVGREELVPRAVGQAAERLSACGATDAALGLLQRSGLLGAPDCPHELLLQEARLLRSRGEPGAAVALLRRIAAAPADSIRPAHGGGTGPLELRARVLCQLGRWLGDSRAESAPNVISGYLIPAARLVAEREVPDRGEVFYTLARYTDELWCALGRREASRDAVRARSIVEDHRQTLKQVMSCVAANVDMPKTERQQLRRHATSLNGLVQRATEEETRLQADRRTYLLQSVKAYAAALRSTDKHDTESAFRLLTLWLGSIADTEVNHFLAEYFNSFKQSHKFVPLAYQLVSRLNQGTQGPFQGALQNLVEELLRQHPHHMLYHLSALSMGDVVPQQQSGRDAFVVDLSRVEAARSVITSMCKRNQQVRAVHDELGPLIQAYVEFAFHPVQKELDGKRLPVPKGLAIARVRDCRNAVVTSLELPPTPDGDYKWAPRVKGFEAHYVTAGGLNLPKVVRCLGSDGEWYRQLVKGRDDLRQDAVCEQLFELCNKVLRRSPDARKAALQIRTYKVVPLTPTSGVVQWVEHTIPIGEWLIGRRDPARGAHARYHPKEILTTEARRIVTEAAGSVDCPASPGARSEAFARVCELFTPVMHHFFLERFPAAERWLQARNSYTRSTAAASMVGYVIGLGDRHSQNILVDTGTGEVVHIDLGVAFDKGRTLPVPELVPFRLTRDTVDGFGVCGVEGHFRSCCEATMRVLRESKHLLTTVVEVFVHDPLYNYSLDPSRILHKQKEFVGHIQKKKQPAPDRGNADAELALTKVNEKLEGFDDGQYLSVEGQVTMLIKQATSLDTLALMYTGWAPWV